jgi:hypothetical protein
MHFQLDTQLRKLTSAKVEKKIDVLDNNYGNNFIAKYGAGTKWAGKACSNKKRVGEGLTTWE